jgi:O-antigen/teichoic acid export membrane protein
LKGTHTSHLRWSYFSTLTTAVMQLLAAATITRFLQPRDYGLAAIAMLCFSLTGYLTQLGMMQAIVQKPGLTDGNIRAAFSVSFISGMGGFVVLVALSNTLDKYFREPRLHPVLLAFGLNLIFNGASSVAGGLLRRELRIRDLAICDFLGYFLSTFGVGLPLAIKGFGVWALVGSNVSQPFLVAVFYFIACPHPILPTFERKDYRHIMTFGGKTSFLTAIEALSGSLDTIIMARVVPVASLGIYNRSLTLSTQPGYNISMGLVRVFHPAIARAAERSVEECRLMLAKAIRELMALIIPICAGAAVTAPTLIPVVFGRQWSSAIPIYQMLCLVAVLDASFHLPSIQLEVFNTFRGKLYLQISFGLAFGAGTALLAPRFGVFGVATFFAFMQLLRTLRFQYLSAHSTKTPVWSYFKYWTPGVAAALFAGVVLYFLQLELNHTNFLPVIKLITLIVTAFVSVIVFYRIFFSETVYEPWISLIHGETRDASGLASVSSSDEQS